MPILATDLDIYLSVVTGSAGNSVAGTTAGALGKYISTTTLVDATLDNLFGDISGADNAADVIEYRCVFLRNKHATLTYQAPYVWLSDAAGGAVMSIGVDTTAASAIGSATAQALTVVDVHTAPAGVSFSAPTAYATGLALGDIPAGQCKAIWVKRQANNTGALASDSMILYFQGDTAA